MRELLNHIFVALIMGFLLPFNLIGCARPSSQPASVSQHPVVHKILGGVPPKDYRTLGVGPFGDEAGLETMLLMLSAERHVSIIYREMVQNPQEAQVLDRLIEGPNAKETFILETAFPFHNRGHDSISTQIMEQVCIPTRTGAYPFYRLKTQDGNKKTPIDSLFTVFEPVSHKPAHARKIVFLHLIRDGSTSQIGSESGSIEQHLADFIHEARISLPAEPQTQAHLIRHLFPVSCQQPKQQSLSQTEITGRKIPSLRRL